MTDVIGGGAVDGQEIGGIALAERIAFDGGFGEIQREGIAEGGTADIVVVFLIETGDVMGEDGGGFTFEKTFPGGVVRGAFLIGIDGIEGIPSARDQLMGLVLCVEADYPFRQFLHIPGAGAEAAFNVVKPEGPGGSMTGGENRGAVFERNADNAGLEIGGEHQFVGDGRGEQVAGRHISGGRCAADGLDGIVLGAINGLPGCLVDPVVACDAVDRGYRSGEDGGMADGGEGGQVADIGVFAGEAFVEQSPEAARAVAVIIAI